MLIPPPIVIDPRTAGAVGTAIVCGLLLLQYAHRRKPFILAWATGWLILTPAFLVISPTYTNARLAQSAVGLSQFLRICSGLLFLWSADLYRQTRYVQQKWLKILIAMAVWFVLAPALLGTGAVLAPGHIITAILLAAAGSMYVAVLLERRMIGAGLTALVLLGLAITSLAQAVTLVTQAAGAQSSSDLFVVNVALAILAAVGIHLLVFEDMTYELRLTNRRLERAREELLLAATTDPLTGCHNRRFLDRSLQSDQRHARARRGRSRAAICRALPEAPHPRSGLCVSLGRRRIPRADYVRRRGGAQEGGGAEDRVRPRPRGGRTAARHRPERRIDRGACRHDRSAAGHRRRRRADVSGQGQAGAGTRAVATSRRAQTRRAIIAHRCAPAILCVEKTKKLIGPRQV
jgi:hypothetical protein